MKMLREIYCELIQINFKLKIKVFFWMPDA